MSNSHSSNATAASVLGRRLKQARLRKGMPQDKLGVTIGLDEHTASARISRYESGVHEPPIRTSQQMAKALGVPLGYLYSDDDRVAAILLAVHLLTVEDQDTLLNALNARLIQQGRL